MVSLEELGKGAIGRSRTHDPLALMVLQAIPEAQQLQYSVFQFAVVDGTFERFVPSKVELYSTAAIPYYKGRGSAAIGFKLSSVLGNKLQSEANPELLRQPCCFIAARSNTKEEEIQEAAENTPATAPPQSSELNGNFPGQQVNGLVEQAAVDQEATDQEWFAEVLAWVRYETPGGEWSPPHAYVKWYERDPDGEADSKLLGMQQLRVEQTERQGRNGNQVLTDFTDLLRGDDILNPVYVQPHLSKPNICFYNPYVR